MSPLFKQRLPFKSLCITIQILSITLTTLMERRVKFW